MLKFTDAFRKPLQGNVYGAIVSALIGVILFLFPIGDALSSLSYDLPFLFKNEIPSGLVMVYIDPKVKMNLGEAPSVPLHRSYHTLLLKRLATDKPRLVFYDVLFVEPDPDPSVDQAFADSVKALGSVVLVSEIVQSSQANTVQTSLVPPLSALTNAGAQWGLARLTPDPCLAIRQIDAGSEQYPSASWVAATMLKGDKDPDRASRIRKRWLNYYGPTANFAAVNFDHALNLESLPAGFFKDKIVVIGSRPSPGAAGAYQDQFSNPYSRMGGGLSTGAEIHALSILNLLEGDFLLRFPFVLELAATLLVGFGFGFGLPFLKPIPAAFAAIVGAGVAALSAHLLVWDQHLWFSWAIVLVQIATAWGSALITTSVRTQIQKANLERSLALHLSSKRARQVANRLDLLAPGAQKQEISLLFSDIENYSTISERTRLDELMALVNRYFEATAPCIKNNDGTIIKFIGDAIFAIWNAPEKQSGHADLACRAALNLREKLLEFESSNESFRLRTRVGLHFGEASVGNFGSVDRFDYTAIGPSVNLAARLEGLNKHLGTDILLSDDLLGATTMPLITRPVGHFRFKGLDRVIKVHELIGKPEADAGSRLLREIFKHALREFTAGEFDRAEAAFHEVLKIQKDGPTLFYLKLLRTYRANPPTHWLGEVSLDEK
jgi:adenylate cyclase